MKISYENFLFEYYLFDAVIGKFADDERTFYALGDVFGISDEELDGLYDLTRRESVLEISTRQDYLRYRRLEQYGDLFESDEKSEKDEKTVIGIKGEAMEKAENNRLFAADPTSRYIMLKELANAAAKGDVTALKILGFVECEGIIFVPNAGAGLVALGKAMEWGDLTATLAYLRYSPSDRVFATGMLAAIVEDTPFEGLTQKIRLKYGLNEPVKSEELSLLRKAIEAQKVNGEVYESMYARLVYSEVLSLKDKKKILFSERKDLLSECCDLPLGIKSGTLGFDEDKFIAASPARKKEVAKILAVVNNFDLRTLDDFRPLFISTASDYIAERYVAAFKAALKGVNVETIDVGDLEPIDLEPTANNVFLRSIDEYRGNVIIFRMDKEAEDEAFELVKNVLKSAKRKRFTLARPPVSLDLGEVLPIVISSPENAKKLKDLVETVDSERVAREEKPAFIADVFRLKCLACKAGALSLGDDAVALLSTLTEERASEVLDDFIKRNRSRDVATTINEETIKPYVDARAGGGNGYGFGGGFNEKI